MKVLVVCQGPAYGDERSYNGLRLAGALAKRDDTDVKVFLIGDGVTCAVAGQNVPDGYYHLDRMIATTAPRSAVAPRASTPGRSPTATSSRPPTAPASKT